MTPPPDDDAGPDEGPRRWAMTELTSLAREVDPHLAGSGLYVIHFGNGDSWVGATVDLPAPFSAMRRRWPEDIESVEYVPALLHEVAHAQETVVATLAEHGSRVRNGLLEGLAPSPVLFDRTVDPVAQTGWLIGEMLLLDPADRAALAAHRSEQEDYDADQVIRYGELAASDAFESAFLAAATYLDVAVPAADLTEERWWTLVVLPDGAGTSGGAGTTGGLAFGAPTREAVRRLLSVRVCGAEVLAVVEASAGERQVARAYLHLEPRTVLPRRFADRLAPVTLTDADGSTTQAVRLPFESPEELVLALVEDTDVLLGARWLALDLMRRGSGALGAEHNVPMSDAVFAYMEAASAPLDGDGDGEDEEPPVEPDVG